MRHGLLAGFQIAIVADQIRAVDLRGSAAPARYSGMDHALPLGSVAFQSFQAGQNLAASSSRSIVSTALLGRWNEKFEMPTLEFLTGFKE